MNWDIRNCPLCDSDLSCAKPEIVSNKPANLMTFEEVKSYFVGIRKGQVFFTYYRCLKCDLLYCPYYFNEDQLRMLYAEMPDNLMGEAKSIVSKTHMWYVNWIMSKQIFAKNYIEIGPDIGLVTREIDARLPIEHAFLVEPNKNVHMELSLNMPNCKDKNIVENLDNVEFSNFDLVVGIHVYDHLLEPVSDLKKLNKMCATNSNLAIVVHNEKSKLRYFMKKAWPPFCLQHPQLYNPNTLSKLLELSGWQLVEFGSSINWFNLRHLSEMGIRALGMPEYLSKFFPDIQLPFKLGNIISWSRFLDSTKNHP